MNNHLLYIDSNTEKLAITLFIALFMHIMVIYSIGFVMPQYDYDKEPSTTMEIILVPKNRENIPVPKQADYLAQFNQKGGGETQDIKDRRSTPTIAPFSDHSIGENAYTPPQLAAPATQLKILTTAKLAQHSAQQKVILPDKAEPRNSAKTTIKTPISENTLLINASAARLANLQAELDTKFNSYTKQPRKKYINASTKAYYYANYMDTWRRKVEEIGSINYPNKARQQQLSGSLILDVILNSNGTIHRIEIKQSSGYKILDEAALGIVRLAAPFEPFPEYIRKETDLLHITRTWDFRYNNLISR